jgi:hypothetical protein
MKDWLKNRWSLLWPKKWLRVVDLGSSGPVVVMSYHRTSADALLSIQDPLSERVTHVDRLPAGSIFLRGDAE